eukprot:scaffold1413_cov297-Pavlova_lutheri.AAC.1
MAKSQHAHSQDSVPRRVRWLWPFRQALQWIARFSTCVSCDDGYRVSLGSSLDLVACRTCMVISKHFLELRQGVALVCATLYRDRSLHVESGRVRSPSLGFLPWPSGCLDENPWIPLVLVSLLHVHPVPSPVEDLLQRIDHSSARMVPSVPGILRPIPPLSSLHAANVLPPPSGSFPFHPHLIGGSSSIERAWIGTGIPSDPPPTSFWPRSTRATSISIPHSRRGTAQRSLETPPFLRHESHACHRQDDRRTLRNTHRHRQASRKELGREGVRHLARGPLRQAFRGGVAVHPFRRLLQVGRRDTSHRPSWMRLGARGRHGRTVRAEHHHRTPHRGRAATDHRQSARLPSGACMAERKT